MNENNDAHKVALEWVKQIITLSTATVVFSGTFVTQIFKHLNWSLWLLVISWLLLVSAIIFCLETISMITNSRIYQDDLWTSASGRSKAKASKWLFILGIFFFVVFAIINFYIHTTGPE